jgi:membrane protease YdiL (CAAX protease family)
MTGRWRMEHETSVAKPPTQPFRDSTSSGFSRKIFLNAEGLRAGWRLLLYFVLVVAFFLGLRVLLAQFWKPTPGTFSTGSLFLMEVIGFASAFGAAVVMSFIERRPIGAYGLPVRSAFGKLFWQGCLLGILEISLLIGLIYAFGGYSFGRVVLHGTELLHWGLLWAICLLFVGLFEEFLFRGYNLFTLNSGIGFWPAALILSLLFAAVHLQNSGEGLIGVAGVFVVGMLWCFAVRRTGTLWFAVGMHAAYDFGETFLYSVPDSGMLFPGHLSSASLHGPAWLTGGTVGPEASVFYFLIFFILFYVIHRFYPAKIAPDQPSFATYRTNSEANTNLTPRV